jgi:fluoroquinolone resistance protein
MISREEFEDTGFFKDEVFERIDLTSVASDGKRFENCLFKNCDMVSGVFSGSIFKNCTIQDCDMSNSVWDGSKIIDCIIKSNTMANCSMRDCRFRNFAIDSAAANLNGLSFNGSRIHGDKLRIHSRSKISFANCVIQVNKVTGFFDGCDFTETKFETPSVAGGFFTNCTLVGAKFRKGCSFDGNTFDKCNLNGCKFMMSTFRNTNLKNCNMTNSGIKGEFYFGRIENCVWKNARVGIINGFRRISFAGNNWRGVNSLDKDNGFFFDNCQFQTPLRIQYPRLTFASCDLAQVDWKNTKSKKGGLRLLGGNQVEIKRSFIPIVQRMLTPDSEMIG